MLILTLLKYQLNIAYKDKGDHPERSLFYWARDYSSSLNEGENYSLLPQTIVISIAKFPLFGCREFYSEFRPLEVTRHTLLTDKMCLYFFELPKLPELSGNLGDDELLLWLHLFNAETNEEMEHIQDIGGPIMAQAVAAYRRVLTLDEERERLRIRTGRDEAQALYYERRKTEERERKKWEGVVAEKDAHIAELEALITQS